MIPGDSNESLTEDGPVSGYTDDGGTELDQVNELLEAVADVLADYANEIGVVPSISRLYNATMAYES